MEGNGSTKGEATLAQEEGPQPHQPAANTPQVIDGQRAPSSELINAFAEEMQNSEARQAKAEHAEFERVVSPFRVKKDGKVFAVICGVEVEL